VLKLQHKLKTFILCLATLFCAGLGTLGAQAMQVGIAEPKGAESLSQLKKDIRNAFTSALTKANGFQVIDQARTDMIAQERIRQGERLDAPEVRQMNIRGVDYLLLSEITTNEMEDFNIHCEMFHLESERVVGSYYGKLVGFLAQQATNTGRSQIANTCEEIIASIIDQANKNAVGRSSRTLNQTLFGGDDDEGYEDMNVEIRRAIMANPNTKWREMGSYRELQINTAGVRFNERREHGMTVFRVSGRVQIILNNKKDSIKSNAVVVIKDFSERNKELVRLRLLDQIKAESNNIIRDLLAGQVDEWDW